MLPIFAPGVRVALVKRSDGPNLFGVAMNGGKHVVALPPEYDGMTAVNYLDGWIIVSHPKHPPLLADTTTGKHSRMNPELAASLGLNPEGGNPAIIVTTSEPEAIQ